MFRFVHSFVPFRAKTLTPAITTAILHVINVTVCIIFVSAKQIYCCRISVSVKVRLHATICRADFARVV